MQRIWVSCSVQAALLRPAGATRLPFGHEICYLPILILFQWQLLRGTLAERQTPRPGRRVPREVAVPRRVDARIQRLESSSCLRSSSSTTYHISPTFLLTLDFFLSRLLLLCSSL